MPTRPDFILGCRRCLTAFSREFLAQAEPTKSVFCPRCGAGNAFSEEDVMRATAATREDEHK